MADPTFHSAVGFSDITGTSSLILPSMATTTGRFLVAMFSKYQASTTLTGVTDTAGNTWARAGASEGGDSSHLQEIWYTEDPITGNAANVVTASLSGTSSYRSGAVAEFSLSGATAMNYDASATLLVTSSGTTHTSNNLATGGTDALIFGAWTAWGTPKELSSSTGTIMWEDDYYPANADGAAIAYRLTDAAGSYSIALTSGASEQYAVNARSFTFTVPGVSARGSLMLLGVGF